jgi:hypothetical protein
VVVIAVMSAVNAAAQMPNPYGPSVSVENAKKAAAAALAEARTNNWRMAVAIVDPGGILVYYEKMDNTQVGSADVAIEKARTAVRFKRPSKALRQYSLVIEAKGFSPWSNIFKRGFDSARRRPFARGFSNE